MNSAKAETSSRIMPLHRQEMDASEVGAVESATSRLISCSDCEHNRDEGHHSSKDSDLSCKYGFWRTDPISNKLRPKSSKTRKPQRKFKLSLGADVRWQCHTLVHFQDVDLSSDTKPQITPNVSSCLENRSTVKNAGNRTCMSGSKVARSRSVNPKGFHSFTHNYFFICSIWILCLASCLSVGTAMEEPPKFTDFRFVEEPSDIIVTQGQSAILHCSVFHSEEEVTVTWFRDGQQLIPDTRRRLLSNGSLSFTEVVHSRSSWPDKGVYHCQATADGATLVSRSARLYIAYLEATYERGREVERVVLGDTVVLRCDLRGHPRPTLTWLKNDQPLQASASVHVYEEGVLELENVGEGDLASYRCRGSNVERTISGDSVRLEKKDPDTDEGEGRKPEFVARPEDSVVEVGEGVALFCSANGLDSSGARPTTAWLKDGVAVDTGEEGRHRMMGSGSLHISSVQLGDAGLYICRAENLEDTIDASATLTVQEGVRLVERPVSVVAREKEDAVLTCRMTGDPPPRLSWSKNGEELITSEYFQIIDGSLKIMGLVQSDSGFYQCFGENNIDNVQTSAQLIVMPQAESSSSSPLSGGGAPESARQGGGSATTPLMSPDSGLGLRNNGVGGKVPGPPTGPRAVVVAARFVTLAWSEPDYRGPVGDEELSYTVFWREDGSDRERVLNTTQLEANLQQLRPDTLYSFRILAVSRFGSSLTAADLQVSTRGESGVPGMPRDLTVTPVLEDGSFGLQVLWQPPVPRPSATAVTHYLVFYIRLGEKSERNLTTQHTTFEMADLSPHETFSLRVAAVNSAGPGPSSDEVTATTFQDTPDDAPQNVTVTADSSTSAVMRWEAPVEERRNGIITGYKVRYRPSTRGSRGVSVTVPGDRRSVALNDLGRDTSYKFRVAAMTINGTGLFSDWLLITTPVSDLDDSQPPGKPRSLSARGLTDSIIVNWYPPADQVRVDSYVLGYGKNIPDDNLVELDANMDSFHIKGLDPRSRYIVTVKALNKQGPGPTSVTEVLTRDDPGEAGLPLQMPPPVGVKALALSPVTMLLVWTDQMLGEGTTNVPDNRYYTIMVTQIGTRRQRLVNSTELNAFFDNLRPFTRYEFAVRVTKGRRKSIWSMSAENMTQEAKPGSPPRSVTITAVAGTPGMVQVTWDTPKHPNGRINGYMVYYTDDSNNPDTHWEFIPVQGSTMTVSIPGLEPSRNYFFKVQGRNRKGEGPKSATVVFHTPDVRGRGGGHVRLDVPGLNNNNGGYYPNPGPGDTGGLGLPTGAYGPTGPGGGEEENPDDTQSEQVGGIARDTMWIIIGCIAAVIVVLFLAVVVIVCRRRRHARPGDRPKPFGPGAPPTPRATNPPDLWIHEHMEMKPVQRGGAVVERGRSAESLSKMAAAEYDDEDDEDMRTTSASTADRRRSSFMPGRAVATVAALPSGPLGLGSPQHEHLPQGITRPIYPRTQYPGAPSPGKFQLLSTLEKPLPQDPAEMKPLLLDQYRQDYRDSLSRRRRADESGGGISACDSPSSSLRSSKGTGKRRGSGGLRTPTTPLSLPPQSAPNTPALRHQIVRPQQQQMNPPLTSPTKRAKPIAMPLPPRLSKEEAAASREKSYSAEELTQEMNTLEGLMKDLSAITQSDFTC